MYGASRERHWDSKNAQRRAQVAPPAAAAGAEGGGEDTFQGDNYNSFAFGLQHQNTLIEAILLILFQIAQAAACLEMPVKFKSR